MTDVFKSIPLGKVKLLPGTLQQRTDVNHKYLMSLKSWNLLQNFYLEAGLYQCPSKPEDFYWGWESPSSMVRGHFLGHWLSAAAKTWANTGDAEIKAKADKIVVELGKCQKANGGEWAGSTPEKYLTHFLVNGPWVWAPQYVHHKTLMGLYNMYALAGNEQALDIMKKWADWFHRWSMSFTKEKFDDILDMETGGMLEVWADLYGVTGDDKHLDLIHRYDRRRLFDRLLKGEDPLTNMHANTTIPEVHGAARAWEVTGEKRWRDIVEAYWKCAVTDRGSFCTGAQTCAEVWTPAFDMSARLGPLNQEHCTVYNMMRLATYLLRWTGKAEYADYYERNLVNGIISQQHPQTGMITYYLQMQPGGQKKWGTPTETFWCCHGTLVQAHTEHPNAVFFEDSKGIAVCQYIPAEMDWQKDGAKIRIATSIDCNNMLLHKPMSHSYDISVKADAPVKFILKLRMPTWLSGKARITLNGKAVSLQPKDGYVGINREWKDDSIHLEFPMALTACPLPGEPDMVAFMEGPTVLAGLCDEERRLHGDAKKPETILTLDNEREWFWKTRYRTQNQERGLSFVALNDIVDEKYTIYFPIGK